MSKSVVAKPQICFARSTSFCTVQRARVESDEWAVERVARENSPLGGCRVNRWRARCGGELAVESRSVLEETARRLDPPAPACLLQVAAPIALQSWSRFRVAVISFYS